MQQWMRLIASAPKMRQITLLTLSLMVAGCSLAPNPTPTWPTNLNVIELSGGGVCLDHDSAVRLAEFKASLEAM